MSEVDPKTPEGRRRTRRGGFLAAAAVLTFSLQGVILRNALSSGSWLWWLAWIAFVGAVIAGFVIEHRREKARRS